MRNEGEHRSNKDTQKSRYTVVIEEKSGEEIRKREGRKGKRDRGEKERQRPQEGGEEKMRKKI